MELNFIRSLINQVMTRVGGVNNFRLHLSSFSCLNGHIYNHVHTSPPLTQPGDAKEITRALNNFQALENTHMHGSCPSLGAQTILNLMSSLPADMPKMYVIVTDGNIDLSDRHHYRGAIISMRPFLQDFGFEPCASILGKNHSYVVRHLLHTRCYKIAQSFQVFGQATYSQQMVDSLFTTYSPIEYESILPSASPSFFPIETSPSFSPSSSPGQSSPSSSPGQSSQSSSPGQSSPSWFPTVSSPTSSPSLPVAANQEMSSTSTLLGTKVAGIIVGTLLGLSCMLILFFFVLRKKRSGQKPEFSQRMNENSYQLDDGESFIYENEPHVLLALATKNKSLHEKQTRKKSIIHRLDGNNESYDDVEPMRKKKNPLPLDRYPALEFAENN